MSDLIVEAYVEASMHQGVIDVSTHSRDAYIPGIRTVEIRLKVTGEPIAGSYDDLFRKSMAFGKTLIVTLAADSPWRELKYLRSSLEVERIAVASLQRQLQQATCKHKFQKQVNTDEDSGGNMRDYVYYICSKCGKEKP